MVSLLVSAVVASCADLDSGCQLKAPTADSKKTMLLFLKYLRALFDVYTLRVMFCNFILTTTKQFNKLLVFASTN